MSRRTRPGCLQLPEAFTRRPSGQPGRILPWLRFAITGGSSWPRTAPGRTSISLGPTPLVPWLTRRWKVTPSWVYTAVADKRIPYLKIGKFIRFDEDRIAKYEAEQQQAGGR